MSALKETLNRATKEAMKAREKDRVATLRMVNAELKRIEREFNLRAEISATGGKPHARLISDDPSGKTLSRPHRGGKMGGGLGSSSAAPSAPPCSTAGARAHLRPDLNSLPPSIFLLSLFLSFSRSLSLGVGEKVREKGRQLERRS